MSRPSLLSRPVTRRLVASFAFVLLSSLATAVSTPETQRLPGKSLEIKSTVELLAPSQIATLAVHIPADGALEFECLVQRGGAITLHLISRPASFLGAKTNRFQMLQEFSMHEVKSGRRTARVAKGDYFIALINSNSQEDSAVRIFARLHREAGNQPTMVTGSIPRT